MIIYIIYKTLLYFQHKTSISDKTNSSLWQEMRVIYKSKYISHTKNRSTDKEGRIIISFTEASKSTQSNPNQGSTSQIY